MNYLEIIKRTEELETELQDLHKARIESAQSHSDLHVSIDLETGISVDLDLDYSELERDVVTIKQGDAIVSLTPGDFTEMGMELQKYNDAIFSYMSEIEKQEAVAAEEADETVEEA